MYKRQTQVSNRPAFFRPEAASDVFVNFGDDVEGMIHITEADAVEVSLTQEEVQYESVGRMGESFRSRND